MAIYTTGGGVTKRGNDRHVRAQKFTSEELVQTARAYLCLTAQPRRRGEESIGEGVKRLTGSRRPEGALMKALSNWKRTHPTEWAAVQREAEEDPETCFRGLLLREADTRADTQAHLPERLAKAALYLAPRYPDSPELTSLLLFEEVQQLLHSPRSVNALLVAFRRWRKRSPDEWEAVLGESRRDPDGFFAEMKLLEDEPLEDEGELMDDLEEAPPTTLSLARDTTPGSSQPWEGHSTAQLMRQSPSIDGEGSVVDPRSLPTRKVMDETRFHTLPTAEVAPPSWDEGGVSFIPPAHSIELGMFEEEDGDKWVVDPRSLPKRGTLSLTDDRCFVAPPLWVKISDGMGGGGAGVSREPAQQLLCPCCPHRNTFTDAHQLEAHLARAHFPCRPYPCLACGGVDRFGTELELREHCQRAHGLSDGQFPLTYAPADDEEAFARTQVERQLRMALD